MRSIFLMAASALAGSLLTALFLFNSLGARAGSPTGICSTQNGDVNADARIDIADATTILGFLFLGSPAELVPLCKPEVFCGLPATGQTMCDGVSPGPDNCGDTTCPGQDAHYQAGCPPEERFLDNGDGTVTDNCTGLMWQKNTPAIKGNFNYFVDWCRALDYCDNLTFAGHDDWRLPNVVELMSLIDYGDDFDRTYSVFDPPPITRYWSSTVGIVDHDSYYVDFQGEGSGRSTRNGEYCARAVRTVR